MKIRRILSFMLILILLLSLSPIAFAAVEVASGDETFSGEHDATVMLAGSSTDMEADVHGILFDAGMTVSVGGSSEYAFVAGNTVALNGICSRDAFAAGNVVGFSGNVGRDMSAAGNTLNLSGSIGRDLYAGGKSVYISGKIGGDVLLYAETIQIAEGAEIGGNLSYNSSAMITAPDAILARASVYTDETSEEPAGSSVPAAAPAVTSGPAAGEPAASAPAAAESAPTPAPAAVPHFSALSKPSPLAKVKSWFYPYVGLVLLAFALLWLTPLWEKLDRDYTGADFGKYAAAFGIGFAVLVALPIAAIILMITGFGLRPAIVLVLLYSAVITAAPVVLGFFIGTLIWRLLIKRPVNYWAELAIGILVWRILSLIPGLKLVTSLVTVPLALGVLTRMLGRKKAATASPVPVAPAAVTQ